MVKQPLKSAVFDSLKGIVEVISKPVSPADLGELHRTLQETLDRSHQLRTIIKAWKEQQTQDRRIPHVPHP